MGTKRWRVTLDGVPHAVELRHGYWSAKRVVTVDGREVVRVEPTRLRALEYWQSSTEHPFEIDGHPAAVRVVPQRVSYRFALVVDGRSVEDGAPVGELPPPKLSRSAERPQPRGRRAWAGVALVIVGPLAFTIAAFGVPELRYAMGSADAEGVVVAHYQVAGRYGPQDALRYQFLVPGRGVLAGHQQVSHDLYQRVADGSPVSVQYASADPTLNRVDREIGRRFLLLYGGLFLALDVLVAASLLWSRRRSGVMAARAAVLAARGARSTGRVTSVEVRRNGAAAVRLVGYRFVDANGERHDASYTMPATTPSALRVGDTLSVRYDPARPTRSVSVADEATG